MILKAGLYSLSRLHDSAEFTLLRETRRQSLRITKLHLRINIGELSAISALIHFAGQISKAHVCVFSA